MPSHTAQNNEKRLQADLSEAQGKAGETKEMCDQLRQGHKQAEAEVVRTAAAAELAEKAVDSVAAVVERLVTQVGSAERANAKLDFARTQARRLRCPGPLVVAQTEASEALEDPHEHVRLRRCAWVSSR